MKLALAELKARGTVGIRAALIFYELEAEFGPQPMRTETGVSCSVRGLAQHLGYAPRAFANSFALLEEQRLITRTGGAYCLTGSGSLLIVAAQSVANCRSATEIVAESVADKTTKSPKNGQLFSLPEIPEQRKQRNRIYSNSPKAIQKRRERYRQNQNNQKCRKRSQTVANDGEMSPVANIAINNSLAVPKLTPTICKHLATLGIEVEALYREHKPLAESTQTQLAALGIAPAYYSVLAERYFDFDLTRILADLHRKAAQPKYKQYTQTPNHTTCTFLRWIIRGIEGDRYGRRTVRLRLSSAQQELLAAPHLSPTQKEQAEIDSIFDSLPWNSKTTPAAGIGA